MAERGENKEDLERGAALRLLGRELREGPSLCSPGAGTVQPTTSTARVKGAVTGTR